MTIKCQCMKHLFALVLVCTNTVLLGQIPNSADCVGAFSLCDTSKATFPGNTGIGSVADVYPGSTCFAQGESNSTWLKFTVQQAGFLVFEIEPNDSTSDFDFIVFKQGIVPVCSGLASYSPSLRCNFANSVNSVTGLDHRASDTVAMLGGNNMLKALYVETGNTYYLLVDSYLPSENGFTISFTGTTASFNSDTTQVTISSVQYDPENKLLQLTLSEPVLVSSFSNTLHHEFHLTGVGNVIIDDVVFTNVFTVNRQVMSRNISLVLQQMLTTNANYLVEVDTGSDGNVLIKSCGIETSYDSASFFVSVTDTVINGVDDVFDGKQHIHVYPNPVEDRINIKIDDLLDQSWNASIYDLNGKQVINQQATGQSYQVDISSVPNGTYLLVCTSHKGVYQQKVVVLR